GRRWPDLGHPVLAGVDVEEEVDQGPLERRAGALVDRESRAGDLGAARVVDDVQIRGDVPVRSAAPAATVDRELLAPRPDRDIRLLTADGDVRVGGIRDAQEEVLDLRLDDGQVGVDRLDPAAR